VAAAVEIVDDKIKDVRLAMGGVAHKPWRATAAEKFLIGKSADISTFTQAANIALEAAQPLADNGYKVELTKRAIRRALTVSAQGGGIA
ncbi:xanthine dehydrogenase family protein subunit M, partial [Dolichospermum sp. ST_sed5]|nr:xanthine dehydrogenase family protein subunit M [Dolichospermum sp. ST_sed5]